MRLNKTILKFCVLSVFCVSVFWVFGGIAFAQNQEELKARGAPPLVICGVGNADPCTICDIWKLSDKVVNFALFWLATPILIVVLIAGGFIYLTSGGDAKKTETAKGLLTSAIFGIIIAFAAWLIVDTILKTLVKGNFTIAWQEIEDCPKPLEPVVPDLEAIKQLLIESQTPKNAEFTAELNARMAHNLLSLASNDADCKNTTGSPVGAETTLSEIANRQPITVCSAGCTGKSVCAPNTQLNISTKMLGVLHKIYEIHTDFTITSITTGDHSSVSCHYGGNCVDVAPEKKEDYGQLRAQIQTLGATRAFCETKSGKEAPCDTAGRTDSADPIDHIHASF